MCKAHCVMSVVDRQRFLAIPAEFDGAHGSRASGQVVSKVTPTSQ